MKQLLVLLGDGERGSALVRDRPGKGVPVLESIRYGEVPSAARTIAIVPAARMRTLVIALQPTPPEKRLAVVRYALEDQLAGDVDAQHVVIAADRDGQALVHVVDRAWLNAVVGRMDAGGNRPDAIVAESDLAPAAVDAITWIWSEDGGFLVAPDGRVSILDRSDETLPSGLLLALRAEPAPAQVIVHGPDALANAVHAWSQATGVPFTLEAPWRWNEASDEALAGAPNLMTPELASPSARAPRRGARTR
jgi:type II secretory pathway component PulL